MGGICDILEAAALEEESTLSHIGFDNTFTELYKLMFAKDLTPEAEPIGEPGVGPWMPDNISSQLFLQNHHATVHLHGSVRLL
jgi:hypothetical protein